MDAMRAEQKELKLVAKMVAKKATKWAKQMVDWMGLMSVVTKDFYSDKNLVD